MLIRNITVTGDSGIDYTITVDPVTRAARCDCPHFQYNAVAVCKHIAFIAESLSVRPVAQWGNAAAAPVRRSATEPFSPYEPIPPKPTRPVGFVASNWD